MNADPKDWGVQTEFRASGGATRVASEATVNSLLEVLGADVDPVPSDDDGPLVLTQGSGYINEGSWTIALETRERLDGNGAIPDDLPLGYHRLTLEGRENRLVIVAPAACASMADVRWWGWTVQLYATRSRKSWGIGDFADLRDFASFATADGARFGIVNPLHANLPNIVQEPSPYYPSSREFRNPIYLRIEDIKGADAVGDMTALTDAGTALNADRMIKRDDIWALKTAALRKIWSVVTPGEEFEEYIEVQGDSLFSYATFCALSETHGFPWNQWPSELRHPASPAVAEFAQHNLETVRFHMWVQWLCELQFSQATSTMPFVQDLAIGVNPAGADAWLWQDVMALGVRVGAPPDRFNTRGQDWGLPPFHPWKLRKAEYEPFIRTVRAVLGAGGGIRIDHVMGLFRLYWIPEGAAAHEGAYVQYPWRDLLAILALESSRHGGIVVGEDLGTVEPYMQTELAQRNILSYKLLWFQLEQPPMFPVNSLGTVTTHDLPTITGLFTGRDLEIQHELGTEPNVEATMVMKNRVAGWLDVNEQTDPLEMVTRAHGLLATAGSAVVAATIEDALCLPERPNYPGTTTEWPNWSVALPVELEELQKSPGYQATVNAFRNARGSSQSTE